MSNDLIQPQDTEIIMYQTEDGLTIVDVQMSGETPTRTRGRVKLMGKPYEFQNVSCRFLLNRL